MKKFRIIIALIAVFALTLSVNSEENNNALNEHEINFYTGVFDFSDDGQRAGLFGMQHQNENLSRNSFLGTLSPITGFMITENNAGYIYTGIQAQ